MTLLVYGLVFEDDGEPLPWQVHPCVKLSDHGAHILGVPMFDNHPAYAGKINWNTVDGGYIRGID